MSQAICLLPVVPIRKSSSHRSEMVSQLLFGEAVTIIGEEESFLNVITTYDHYEGWIQKGQLKIVDNNAGIPTGKFTSGFVTEIAFNDSIMRIPYGCEIVSIMSDNPDERNPAHTSGVQDVQFLTAKPFSIGALKEIYSVYLNVPYLWGGRSVFGIDCSGFTQQVFKLLGVKLQRDAYQQAKEGKAVTDLSKGKTGDLVFFNNDEGKIVHVGILLQPDKIVHASAWVRIDSITSEGIFHDSARTHQLHSIRRLIE